MNHNIQEQCDLLIHNKNNVIDAFKWKEFSYTVAAALYLTSQFNEVSTSKLQECEEIIRTRNKTLAKHKENLKVPLLARMAISEDPTRCLDEVFHIYMMFNGHKEVGNEYRMMAALAIWDLAGGKEFYDCVDETDSLYERIRKEYRWMVSEEDIMFAAVLAFSEQSRTALVEQLKNNFGLLKRAFRDNKSVLSASHAMVLIEKPDNEKCRKAISIFDEMKRQKHKIGVDRDLAVLAPLTLIDKSEKEIVALIGEVDDYLKTQKGFGGLSFSPSRRRIIASHLAYNAYGPAFDSLGPDSQRAIRISRDIEMVGGIASCSNLH